MNGTLRHSHYGYVEFDRVCYTKIKFAYWQYYPDSLTDPCRQLQFRAALTFDGSRLINHVIRTIDFVAIDFCGALCYMEPNCVSYNMEVGSGSPSITKCELNNSTHKEHPDDLKPWENYIYQGTMVL